MNAAERGLAERARELRAAFDRGFASDARPVSAPTTDLLLFRAAGEPYALRLSEIAGLFADRKITPLPGADPALLGCAGFREALAPVYDLHALLGRAPAEAPRWLVVAAQSQAAFAFETFEGHRRVESETILPQQASGASHQFVREFASAGGSAWPIVHLPSILDALGDLRAGGQDVKGEP